MAAGGEHSHFDNLAILEAGARALGLGLDAVQLDQFRRYGDTLLRWNERMNLTAITDPAQVQTLHFLDALTIVPEIRAWCRAAGRDDPTLIDIGSGAGVPGIPLKIALPRLRVTLLDATGKRVDFLWHVIDALGLRGIGAVQGRAEELARDAEWRDQFDLVTARALAHLPTLLEWCLPFARPGGLLRAVRPVPLPDLPNRVVVPVDKVGPTPPGFPRGGGLPRKEPLG